MRLLVITTEPVPLPGVAATGAGLRAWGLARGLESRGLKAEIAFPEEVYSGPGGESLAPPPDGAYLFRRAALTELVRRLNPEVLVVQHWGIMKDLGEVNCPIALDLAGPHLLERLFWGSHAHEDDLQEKLSALRRADFVTCSGKFQRHYFLPYLARAGHRMDGPTDPLPVIPFSVPPDLPPEASGDSSHFIYCGFFLPWQDPSAALETLLEVFDATGMGTLDFFGGPHPLMDVSRGRFQALLERLKAHPRVNMRGVLSFDLLMNAYRAGGVALDLMARNPERELAFTTRTLYYLRAGLPVIYNDYSELSAPIRERRAGWTFDPSDKTALRQLLSDLVEGRVDIDPFRQAARRLVQEKYTWDTTISPLADFCSAPRQRDDKNRSALTVETQSLELEKMRREISALKSQWTTLQGKRSFRLYRRLMRSSTWFAPLAFLILLPVSLFLYCWFRFSDAMSKSQRS